MLYAFQPRTRTLEPVTAPPRSGWVHAVRPTEGELSLLRDAVGVPAEFLTHAVDLDEVARVDRVEGASLIMLREPCRTRANQAAHFRSAPVGVVLLDGVLVTIAPMETEIIQDLLALPALAPEQPHTFLLQLVLCTAERFLAHLRTIDREVDALEDRLQVSLDNEQVLELLAYQKSLVHFTSALTSNRHMLERLQKDPRFEISKKDHDLIEDALVEIHQAIEVATVSQNVLGQMMNAFASVISNNVNMVMKILTAFTIVLMIPTLITSFYGMNVPLPGQGHPFASAFVITGSIVVGGVVVAVFARKRWL
ncbi:MAG: magnesium transporter CorA family protein [Myxococcales bacterium]|nr:magnesium transporter CorA family protein [Myxococcales bacterium]